MAGEDEKNDAADGPPRTVFEPSGSYLSKSVPPRSAFPRGTTVPQAGGIDPGSYRQIQIGDVLNHIFEVKRFIARGGMGEVFEGINVNSDERVAIKVVLPNLAADANILAMFRKEARTLTRMNHPALVQYRVLAQEPQLGVFYIVTDFVDGPNLSDVITQLDPSPEDLIQLARRLAGGLEAAHALGAIHRDISHDNVMLEDGLLSGARIIDFGIAKDLNSSAATIIGDGFAGKLNYVAPEQLGDFDRSIGPWTDVYSLGLVLLAVAQRKDVDMGGTLVNAVDKRRAGPDLSPVPDVLRPVLFSMLQADPAKRLRSMGELLDMLPTVSRRPTQMIPSVTSAPQEVPAAEEEAQVSAIEEDIPVAEPEPEAIDTVAPEPEPEVPAEPETVVAAEPVPEPKPDKRAVVLPPAETGGGAASNVKVSSGSSNLPLIIGGVVALLVALVVGLYFVLFKDKDGSDQVLQDDTKGVSGKPASGDVAQVRAALNTGLSSVSCAWLDVSDVSRRGNDTVASLYGVAGQPDDAKGQIAKMLAGKNLAVSSIDFQNVAPIEATECAPLDALRQIRDPQGQHITLPQRQFEMTKLRGGNLAGSLGAMAMIDFNLGDPGTEMALYGIEPSGKISQLTSERSELVGAADKTGDNRYRLKIDVNHLGWSGMLLLTGQKPFDSSLLTGPPGSRTGDWSQKFLAAARERGWKAEMVWFKTVDDKTD